MFLYAAHQTKGIRPLLKSFFGFLERQTDFYNASTEAAQHMVLESFKEFNEVHRKRKQDKYVPIPEKEAASIEEVDGETERDSDLKEAGAEHNTEFVESRRTKRGSVYPNDGDGATYKKYMWTQSPSDVEITIPLCSHRLELKSLLKVDYTATSITVYQREEKVFGGELAGQIKSDEVTWTLEDGMLCLRAEKGCRSWWKQLLVTEPVLLLKPILKKHATVGDISQSELKDMQQTVVNKRDYAMAKHQEQFPDKIPVPDNLK